MLSESLGLGDAVVRERSVGVPVVELQARESLLPCRCRCEVADALAVSHEDEDGRSRGRHLTLSTTRHRAS